MPATDHSLGSSDGNCSPMMHRWAREHVLPLLKSLPWHLFSFPLIPWVSILEQSPYGFLDWYYYETARKLPNLKWCFFFFFATGHFLLLNPSPAEKGAGICKYHLTSPVLPGSDKRCIFQLALYEAAPAAGNLTLLIKAVLSGSTVQTLSLNHTSRGDHRLGITVLVLIHMFVQQYGTVSVYCQ